jgi:drug/metabolite transporter (DMT)-like permease
VVAQVWRGFRLDVPGVAFALGAAAALASYFLLSEHSVRAERDPIGLVAWGALVAAVPLTLVNPPGRFPFAALGTQVALGPWSVPALVPLLWLGLVSTVAAYVTGVAVLRHLPSQVASVLATVEVLIATVIAWALLGERLGAIQLAGGAVLLTGVVVVQLRRPSRHFRPAGS